MQPHVKSINVTLTFDRSETRLADLHIVTTASTVANFNWNTCIVHEKKYETIDVADKCYNCSKDLEYF